LKIRTQPLILNAVSEEIYLYHYPEAANISWNTVSELNSKKYFIEEYHLLGHNAV
jgi:hypothetical protein